MYFVTRSRADEGLPGAYARRGLDRQHSDISSDIHTEFDQIYTPQDPPVVIEIVTDEQLDAQIRQQILQNVEEADAVPFMDTPDPAMAEESPELKKKKRLVRYLQVLAASVLLAAIVVAITVPLNARNKNDEAPASAPTDQLSNIFSIRLDAFRSLLLNNSISGPASLFSIDTPQFKALQWLANDDPAQLPPESAIYDVIKERFILSTLYFSTHGINWTNQYQFLSGKQICDWNNQLSNEPMGVVCGPDNSTQRLDLGTQEVMHLLSKIQSK
jgi:hypothetical protein